MLYALGILSTHVFMEVTYPDERKEALRNVPAYDKIDTRFDHSANSSINSDLTKITPWGAAREVGMRDGWVGYLDVTPGGPPGTVSADLRQTRPSKLPR